MSVIGLLLVGILVYVYYWAFYDMDRLPKGELITEADSPNGTYTLKAYLCNGGAATSYAVLGELNYNAEEKEPKNIYWNYKESTAKIVWLDNDTVIINGHELDVLNERYDFRREY
ncbi:DUF5412 domain-containing protein [Peptococcaceae bacterium 1198_IL3148]